jgi:transposase
VAKRVPVRLRVKQRTKVVEFASMHGIKPASRHFGLDRRTVRTWVRRWRLQGITGLVPQYPKHRQRRIRPEVFELIRIARLEHEWGAPRTRIWLTRVHRVHIGVATIQPAFRALGRPRLLRTRPRRRPRQSSSQCPKSESSQREMAPGSVWYGTRRAHEGPCAETKAHALRRPQMFNPLLTNV